MAAKPFVRLCCSQCRQTFAEIFIDEKGDSWLSFNNEITFVVANTLSKDQSKEIPPSNPKVMKETPTEQINRHPLQPADPTFVQPELIKSSGNQPQKAHDPILMRQDAITSPFVEGKNFLISLEIVNRPFDESLKSVQSERFQNLRETLQNSLLSMYKHDSEYVSTKIDGFRQGSTKQSVFVDLVLKFVAVGSSHLTLLKDYVKNGKLDNFDLNKDYMRVVRLNDKLQENNWCMRPCNYPYKCYPSCNKECCSKPRKRPVTDNGQSPPTIKNIQSVPTIRNSPYQTGKPFIYPISYRVSYPMQVVYTGQVPCWPGCSPACYPQCTYLCCVTTRGKK